MKKIILFIFFSLLFTCFTYGQIRWEQIKPISAQLEKSTFNGNDLLLIEDSEASGVRKFIKLSKIVNDSLYIKNQNTSPQTANFWIDGIAKIYETFNSSGANKNRGLDIEVTETNGNENSILYGVHVKATHIGNELDSIVLAGRFRTLIDNSAQATIATGIRTDLIMKGDAEVDYAFGTRFNVQADDDVKIGGTLYGIANTTINNTTDSIPWVIGISNNTSLQKTGGVQHLRGMYNDLLTTGSSANVETATVYNGHLRHYGTGSIGKADGLYIKLDQTNGHIETGIAGTFDVSPTADATMTNAIGVRIGEWALDAVEPDLSIGLEIDSTIDIGAESWAIYSNSNSESRFRTNIQLHTEPTQDNHLARIIDIKNIVSDSVGIIVETDPTVYSWAKAATKPSYVWSEIGSKPTFATVATSGSYNDLTDKPAGGGGGGVGDIFLTGYVTGRNINILYPDYTPDNGYMLHVLPDSEIPNGTDSISITINGTGARQIYNYFEHDEDYVLELVYAANRWFVLGSKGEDYSVSGKNTGDQDLSGIRDSLYQVWVNQQLNTDIITPQTLVGTSPYWNVNNGRNANITLTGATTITLANLLAGQHGTLSVTNGGSTSYLITFAGYTIKIHDAIRSAANKVVVSGGTATDEFTWYYNGNYVAIRGGLNLW
jgi:hypothetical protein